ncbi:MAG TPA: hypothetical protein PLX23_02495 [Candidatus Hydrogenedens sp.]|nr:hypothetical protein [Candidatus Hydrogenedens sp.]
MLSFVDVRCPHCGAQGKIVLPPLGTILIGPCPACKGMLALFNGSVLPLDNKIILEGTIDEKKKHIIEIFSSFIEDKVDDFFNPKKEESFTSDSENRTESFDSEYKIGEYSLHKAKKKKPITSEELLNFKESEIDSINNPEIFRKYFSN